MTSPNNVNFKVGDVVRIKKQFNYYNEATNRVQMMEVGEIVVIAISPHNSSRCTLATASGNVGSYLLSYLWNGIFDSYLELVK